MRRSNPDVPQCSFCHKKRDVVAKLISSPSDSTRAYICDECVHVCLSILQDEGLPAPPPPLPERPSHCLMCHPDAPRFLAIVEQWIMAEWENRDPTPFLDRVHRMARMMMGLDPA
jgi:hypothetical protein